LSGEESSPGNENHDLLPEGEEECDRNGKSLQERKVVAEGMYMKYRE
jgi:hypothetical protein